MSFDARILRRMHLKRIPISLCLPSPTDPQATLASYQVQHEREVMAYRVPWVVTERQPGSHLVVTNVSEERLRFVRFQLAGRGELQLSLPVHVDAGASVTLTTTGIETLAPEVMITVRWFRERGEEYLWLISL